MKIELSKFYIGIADMNLCKPVEKAIVELAENCIIQKDTNAEIVATEHQRFIDSLLRKVEVVIHDFDSTMGAPKLKLIELQKQIEYYLENSTK